MEVAKAKSASRFKNQLDKVVEESSDRFFPRVPSSVPKAAAEWDGA